GVSVHELPITSYRFPHRHHGFGACERAVRQAISPARKLHSERGERVDQSVFGGIQPDAIKPADCHYQIAAERTVLSAELCESGVELLQPVARGIHVDWHRAIVGRVVSATCAGQPLVNGMKILALLFVAVELNAQTVVNASQTLKGTTTVIGP